ncbi:la-related protein 7-like, partial [Tropilaelaps mercedesae]
MKKDKENRRKRRHNSNENCEDAVENERSTTSKPSTSTKRSRIEEQESFTVEAEGNNPNESKARSAGVMEKAKVKEGGNPSDDVDSVVTTVTRSEQSEQLKEENDASVRKTENTQSSTTDDVQQRQNLNTEDAQQVQADDQPQRKRKRRVRVKKVREDLRQQMEFYFCDANLRKDRYMTELVSKNENGWVEVVEFLKFNKIKALLEEKDLEIGEVVKAVRGSEVIEVSDDLKKIRRNLEKHPVKPKSQQMIDDCTVYVQGLQSIASVEWLRGNFTEFGQVDYVSLPRGPNGRHKGFGFIEFADVASAENACKFYSLQGGRINGPGGSCLDAVGRSWVHGGSGSFGNNLKSNHTNSS